MKLGKKNKWKAYRLERNKTVSTHRQHDYLHMISHTNKKAKRINKFSKVIRYMVNIQKSTIFLCEISKTPLFTIAPKIMKNLGINITKHSNI